MVTTIERLAGARIKDDTSAIVVGTRVSTILYGRGEGIVYRVRDEPPPPPGVIILSSTKHRKLLDIVFLSGGRSKNLHESTLRGIQWQILDKPIAGEAEIAAAVANAHQAEAAAKLLAKSAAEVRASEIDRLRTAPEYAHLTQGDDRYSGKLAGANIRKGLKAAFPGILFSVTKPHHGSLTIRWTDGPVPAAVASITSAYERGTYDGMDESFKDANPPWCDVFGGAEYITAQRQTSSALVDTAISAVFARYTAQMSGIAVPTAEDFKQGRTFMIALPDPSDNLERYIREQISLTNG